MEYRGALPDALKLPLRIRHCRVPGMAARYRIYRADGSAETVEAETAYEACGKAASGGEIAKVVRENITGKALVERGVFGQEQDDAFVEVGFAELFAPSAMGESHEQDGGSGIVIIPAPDNTDVDFLTDSSPAAPHGMQLSDMDREEEEEGDIEILPHQPAPPAVPMEPIARSEAAIPREAAGAHPPAAPASPPQAREDGGDGELSAEEVAALLNTEDKPD